MRACELLEIEMLKWNINEAILAKSMGVSQATVSRLKKGKINFTPIYDVRLCKLLVLPAGSFYERQAKELIRTVKSLPSIGNVRPLVERRKYRPKCP